MNDPIRLASKTLRRALGQSWAQRHRSWLEELKNSLSLVETLLVHMPVATEGKILDPVEQPVQQLSPGLIRTLQDLRKDHLVLWQEVNQLLDAAEHPESLQRLHDQAKQLVQDLEHYYQIEKDLVQEAVNRDTGGED